MGYSDVKIKSGGMFLKIEPGQPKDIRLMDESPTEMAKHQITENGQFKTFDCPGVDDCAYCKSGEHSAPKQRFVCNVWDHGDQKMKLFEYGSSIAKQIQDIAKSLEEENRDILSVDLKIEATGSGLSRKYGVTPRMTARPVPEGLKKLEITKKSDLPF